MYAHGHLAILQAAISRRKAAVAKITGLKNPVITGPARVFDDEQSRTGRHHGQAASSARRRDGAALPRPQGRARACPRCSPPPRRLDRPRAWARAVGLVTDGRFLRRHLGHGGGPRGARGLRRRGVIALVHEGDSVTIDAHQLLLQLNVADDEIARRRAAWSQPAPRYVRGVLAKFAKNASSASTGAVLGRITPARQMGRRTACAGDADPVGWPSLQHRRHR